MKVLIGSKHQGLIDKLKGKIDGHRKLSVTHTVITLTDIIGIIQHVDIDVIVLGEELSSSSSYEAIIKIMSIKPTAVLIVTYDTKIQNEFPEVLNIGMVDIVEIDRPFGEGEKLNFSAIKIPSLVPIKATILGKLNVDRFQLVIDQINKRISLKGRRRRDIPERATFIPKAEHQPLDKKYMGKAINKVIVIGASTGGPRMLTYIVSQFPPDFPPVFIVQHMPEGYILPFAERMNKNARTNVKRGEENDLVLPGNVYIAPGGKHMELKKDSRNQVRISITDGPKVNFVKPAVDVTLLSAIRVYEGNVIAAILTGMGHDGREGCRVLKKFRGQVIALNEADSVVFGMNKSVIDAGLADAVVGMDDVTREIGKRIGYNMS